MNMIRPYEQELFVAATTDDSISKILLGVLDLIGDKEISNNKLHK